MDDQTKTEEWQVFLNIDFPNSQIVMEGVFSTEEDAHAAMELLMEGTYPGVWQWANEVQITHVDSPGGPYVLGFIHQRQPGE